MVFREGVVRIVAQTGKSVAEVARDLGINETTLANWVSRARRAGTAPAGERDEMERLRGEMPSSTATPSWFWPAALRTP
ncbi:transposase [Streptomyces sp. NPDC005251]|uniref:transposase n=1 Tax=Streptomyces sp. NPDC005251 TaxID=3157166 RepID=UPI0033ADAEE3